ncbi:uncharacterized protein TNCV_4509841 [Trichonephila clavipes]|nr:uncharacterized protein TNCV_4509841 [Trichonephila clavipes]
MACKIKLLESEATTGFFVLLGEQGNKAVLGWVMKEGLIPSRYECPKCKKGMRLVERKGTIDGFEWRCRVRSKENPYFVCRSVRKGDLYKTRFKVLRKSIIRKRKEVLPNGSKAKAQKIWHFSDMQSFLDAYMKKEEEQIEFEEEAGIVQEESLNLLETSLPTPIRTQIADKFQRLDNCQSLLSEELLKEENGEQLFSEDFEEAETYRDSQFKKIHDSSIAEEDKMQYLLQSVEPHSKAGRLVLSFPVTVANSSKANSTQHRVDAVHTY